METILFDFVSSGDEFEVCFLPLFTPYYILSFVRIRGTCPLIHFITRSSYMSYSCFLRVTSDNQILSAGADSVSQSSQLNQIR